MVTVGRVGALSTVAHLGCLSILSMLLLLLDPGSEEADQEEEVDGEKEGRADSRAHLKHSLGVGVKRQDLLLGFRRQKRFLFLLRRLHS